MENSLDLTIKFEHFRLVAEQIFRKNKELESVTERLKGEINFSKEVEKNLRNQMCQTQTRLIHTQKSCNEIIQLKDKQVNNERATNEIDKKLEKLSEAIAAVRDKSSLFLHTTQQDIQLLKVHQELQSCIQKKDADFDLLKMELQSIIKEKEELENNYKSKIEELGIELKEAREETEHVRQLSDEAMSKCLKQINDREKVIQQYERERAGNLHSYVEQKQTSILKKGMTDESVDLDGGKKCKVTWGDNTVSSFTEEKQSVPAKEYYTVNPGDFLDGPSTGGFKSMSLTDKDKKLKYSKMCFKPKSKDETHEPPKKRQLYSTNHSHYFY